MDSNEIYEFEDRQYLKPEVSRDEQLAFVDTLRNMQAQNNTQIKTDTHNLGTDVPSNLGGLTGSEGYFQQRYQTPQVDSTVAGLKAAAQASALNQVLTNYQNQMQKRYKDAYNAYQKRSYNYSRRSNSGSGSTSGSTSTPEGEVEYTTGDNEGTIEQSLRSSAPGTTVVWNGITNTETGEPGYDVYDSETGELLYRYDGSNSSSSQSSSYSTGDAIRDFLLWGNTGGSGKVNTIIGGW